jgi:hypothetical protein
MTHERRHLPFKAAMGLAAMALALLALTAPGCKRQTQPPGPPVKGAQKEGIDYHYVGALAAANQLCQAWRNHEYSPTVKDLFSKRMQEKYKGDDEPLFNAIAGPVNPRHSAYTIYGGRRLEDGRYSFQVCLYLTFAGSMDEARIEPVDKEILVVREESGLWKIDDFPVPKPATVP